MKLGHPPSSGGLIYFVHLAAEHDESPRENVTRHTSLQYCMTFPHGKIAESEKRRIVPFICRWNFRGLSDVRCFVRTRETLIQEHINGKRHYPVERNATNNSTACFCCAPRKNCSRASGNPGARNCRVAITFPRKSTNFYPVTCWRAITVALNSDIVCCSCSNNKFRRFLSY